MTLAVYRIIQKSSNTTFHTWVFSLLSSVVFRYLRLLFPRLCWHEMWRYLSLVLEWLTKWSTGPKSWQVLGLYFLPPHPDCLQGPLNCLYIGYIGLFHQGQCDWSMKLITCIHLVPSVKNAWSFTSTASCLFDLVVRHRNFFFRNGKRWSWLIWSYPSNYLERLKKTMKNFNKVARILVEIQNRIHLVVDLRPTSVLTDRS
jgi:hypothetical protein